MFISKIDLSSVSTNRALQHTVDNDGPALAGRQASRCHTIPGSGDFKPRTGTEGYSHVTKQGDITRPWTSPSAKTNLEPFEK